MYKTIVLAYGVLGYGVSWLALLYAVGFVGNVIVPKAIDDGPDGPLIKSIPIDVLLFALFGLQHSLMARRPFKRWWARIVPQPLERSTHVLTSALLLLVLFWQWRAPSGLVWDIETPAIQRLMEILFWLGWWIAFRSTFLIDHFDLFGLRQVYLYARGKEYAPPKFSMPWPYRYVRHPIMLGFLIAFWATPVMTLSHFVFALAGTIYILIGSRLEERDLAALYGDAYNAYRRSIPMILPLPRKAAK